MGAESRDIQLISPLVLSSPFSIKDDSTVSSNLNYASEDSDDPDFYNGLLWPAFSTNTKTSDNNIFKIVWQDDSLETIQQISNDFMKESFPSLLLSRQASHPIASNVNFLAQIFKESNRLECWETLHLVLKYLDLHVYTIQAKMSEQPRIPSIIPSKTWKKLSTIQKMFTSRTLANLYDKYKEAHQLIHGHK